MDMSRLEWYSTAPAYAVSIALRIAQTLTVSLSVLRASVADVGRVSPSRASVAGPSSVSAQRVKRGRELTSSSQRHSKRRSVPAKGEQAETASGSTLPSEPLPAPLPPTGRSDEGKTRETRAAEEHDGVEADDDWGSLAVEDETQQSDSQEEEQTASSQQLSQSSNATSADAHPQHSDSASTASTTAASSDSNAQPVGSSTLNPSPSTHTIASRMALMRLQSDLKAMEHDPPEGISASPIDASNPLVWRACIFGPADTPWVSHLHSTAHNHQHSPYPPSHILSYAVSLNMLWLPSCASVLCVRRAACFSCSWCSPRSIHRSRHKFASCPTCSIPTVSPNRPPIHSAHCPRLMCGRGGCRVD